MPVVNRELIITSLGYLPHKTKVSAGSAYVRTKDEKISKAIKKQRDVEVRNAINSAIKRELSLSIAEAVKNFKPDLILVERNESFHGVLTTKLLAEVRGILDGIAADIPIKAYNVTKIRNRLDLARLVSNYISSLPDASALSGEKHITKRAIKKYLEDKYNARCSNTDESDSLAVFDYYYETEVVIKNDKDN